MEAPQAAAWEGKSLKGKCGCELCRQGIATTHNDDSHDQSLEQNLLFGEHKFNIIGGTTKCARVCMTWIYKNQGLFKGKSIVEVGAGTGLVGLSLAVAGADVCLTDQEPLLELLEHNVQANLKTVSGKHSAKAKVKLLLWNESMDEFLKAPPDIVFGSDLIYAKEAHIPLSETYKALLKKPSQVGYLAYIARFAWEKDFFHMMKSAFTCTQVLKAVDIEIWRFDPKSIAEPSKPSAAPTTESESSSSTAAGQVQQQRSQQQQQEQQSASDSISASSTSSAVDL
eukprot:gb/GEZN01014929.1/.p1 GENE.gb/GEZN01014929.1/~~gb/GEZN01014929.1/.p1  ORF type:complete len:299 (+),score=51.53 gb/GEZN01014929.1/:49-897(+)